jgi:hypothetical protein
MTRIVAPVVLAAAILAAPRGLGAESPASLTVRLYNTAAIPAAELEMARTSANDILVESGVQVRFRHCGRAGAADGAVDRCSEPLTRAEVVVRILDAPAFNTSLDPDAFGVTYIVRETNRGWLATVFADRIGAAAARVRVDAGTLLGRVAAHEVGHLLLGSGYHGPIGVMRAAWPDDVLRDPGGWRFSMRESERMQQALVPAI